MVCSRLVVEVLLLPQCQLSTLKQNKSMELSLVTKADRRKKLTEERSDSGSKKREAEIEREEQSDENEVAVRTALENYVILKIFSHLSPPDLKNCCEVNEILRSIADPMIVCHDVVWYWDDLMVDEINRGHANRQVEKKTWKSGMTGEMTRLVEETWDPGRCIRLTFKSDFRMEKQRAFELFRTFGNRVFALTFQYWWYYLNDVRGYVGEDLEDLLKILMEFLPKLEELFLPELRLEKRKIGKLPSFPPLIYLQKVDFGFEAIISQIAMGEILAVMQNVEEIDNFPVTMLLMLQDANKLHTLRSVQFCSTHDTSNVVNDMQTLVDMGIGLRSLVVGKKLNDWCNLLYIQRNKTLSNPCWNWERTVWSI